MGSRARREPDSIAPMKKISALLASSVLVLALLACKKGEEGGGGKPALDKPIAQMTQDDLKGAVTAMGLSVGSCSNSNSGGMSNFMCTGVKEHENGIASPDGKKRMHVTFAVYTYPADRRAAELTRLREAGAVEESGDRILSVQVKPPGTGDAKDYMKKLRGK